MSYGSRYGKNGYWVNVHEDDLGRGGMLPAVCVKCHSFPSAEDLLNHWPDMSYEQAADLVAWAWDVAVEEFWRDYHGSGIREYFPGYDVEGAAAGRSSGWLVVRGLPDDIEEWPLDLVKNWRRFQAMVLKDIEGRSSPANVVEIIDGSNLDFGNDEPPIWGFIDRVLASLLPAPSMAVLCGSGI